MQEKIKSCIEEINQIFLKYPEITMCFGMYLHGKEGYEHTLFSGRDAFLVHLCEVIKYKVLTEKFKFINTNENEDLIENKE